MECNTYTCRKSAQLKRYKLTNLYAQSILWGRIIIALSLKCLSHKLSKRHNANTLVILSIEVHLVARKELEKTCVACCAVDYVSSM